MKMSEPAASVIWVAAIRSLAGERWKDATDIIDSIQRLAEEDPPSLLPLLELSAYALGALEPLDDSLVDRVARQFGPFLRDRIGLKCDRSTFRSIARYPHIPIDDYPNDLGLNAALYVSFTIFASLEANDPCRGSSIDFAVAALNLKHGNEQHASQDDFQTGRESQR